jgi:xylan 1,4-beta-xylosidase
MAGLLGADRVKTVSSAAVPLDTILKEGVGPNADLDSIATRGDHRLSILIWHYRDDDQPGGAASIDLNAKGLPANVNRVSLRQFRIDANHSNAYTAYQRVGSPQHPSPEQYAALESAGQLQLIDSPRWIDVQAGRAQFHFEMPIQALSLIELTW